MEIEGVQLDYLGHSGFLISSKNEKTIAIDPYNIGTINKKIDVILITHSHYDHCSIKDIEKIAKPGALVIVPADAQSKVTKIKGLNLEVIHLGETFKIGNIKVKTFPAYNLNKKFHEKKEGWFGFILQIGKLIIYHAGDTDNIPEIKKLSGYGKKGQVFIALLPVSGTYVMDSYEAFEVASILKPYLSIPMHYGSGVVGNIQDAERFVNLCKKIGLRAEILNKV